MNNINCSDDKHNVENGEHEGCNNEQIRMRKMRQTIKQRQKHQVRKIDCMSHEVENNSYYNLSIGDNNSFFESEG